MPAYSKQGAACTGRTRGWQAACCRESECHGFCSTEECRPTCRYGRTCWARRYCRAAATVTHLPQPRVKDRICLVRGQQFVQVHEPRLLQPYSAVPMLPHAKLKCLVLVHQPIHAWTSGPALTLPHSTTLTIYSFMPFRFFALDVCV